jgi:DNA-binding NarL/FixJ family response regulator
MEPSKPQEGAGQAGVLFIGNDLMFQSKISSACRQSGMSLGVIRNPKVLGGASTSGASISGAPRLIVVDLGLANLDLAEVLASGRQIWPTTKWLGYGAHVQAERLDVATELGLDAVLTRGQFDRDMVRVLQGFAE